MSRLTLSEALPAPTELTCRRLLALLKPSGGGDERAGR